MPAQLLGDRVVLVVDDNESVCHMTARMLHAAGCRTLEVHSGQEAFDLLDRLGPSVIGLVVSDVVMPGVSGFDLAEKIPGRWPGTAVLLISGEAGRRDDYAGVFLRKPFGPDDLVAAAVKALREIELASH